MELDPSIPQYFSLIEVDAQVEEIENLAVVQLVLIGNQEEPEEDENTEENSESDVPTIE